jgi:hypothetical protein
VARGHSVIDDPKERRAALGRPPQSPAQRPTGY